MHTVQEHTVYELEEKLDTLERKSQELEDSILYASRLQRAILPPDELFKQSFNQSMVYYRPRDIVSGDFYWTFTHGSKTYFAVGDCTGHGVPGAMVSMSGMAILRQLIRIRGLSSPSQILARLDEEITGLFNDHLTEGVARDGIDMALCCYDQATNHASYAGAGRSLLMVRNGELTEYASTFVHIGYFDGRPKEFIESHVDLLPGDQLYLFTDGFTDQFGGDKVKKFNRKRFRSLLLSLEEMDMERQRKELDAAFEGWKGHQEQLDDVCVVGVRI